MSSFSCSSSYQLALITPGTSPARASFRKQMRHSRNLRRNPRGRPQRKQRLRCRQLSLGVLAAFATASRSSLAILAVVAIVSPKSRAERHAEMLQQRHALGIGLGGGRNANIHSLEFLDFVVVDLGKNQLILDPQRVVTAAIEGFRRNAAEV